MEFFFDMLIAVLPATVVALVAYFLVKQMLVRQLQIQEIQVAKERQNAVTPLRMQAYERLSIFVERMAVPGLLMRTDSQNMQAGTLRVALMMTVQQEFEHNISQQVYVSEKLWEIVKATRDDLIQFIDLVADKLPKDASAKEYREALLGYYQQREHNPITTAQMAIRREANSLF